MEQSANRTYRLRGSRITGPQQRALDAYWHLYGISYQDAQLDINALFPDSRQVILEIGFGMGEATALIAQKFPETGFFAVEVHRPGIGKLMARIEELQVRNIRIIEGDAHLILKEFIPEDSIDAIHLFFPDPWPKLRHRKRRIIQPEFVELMASRLKPNGYVQIATDWKEYADWMERIFKLNPRFSGGVIERPNWRPISKFEGKGLRKGHLVTDLKFVKVS